jgi:hypothetical protein
VSCWWSDCGDDGVEDLCASGETLCQKVARCCICIIIEKRSCDCFVWLRC